jgi:uncharacterized protein (DUF1800 family)
MALDPKGAALALHRFGFGPRPGSIAAIASDPRGALLADLDRPNAGQVSATTGLLTSGAANRAAFEFFAERNAKARVARLREEEAKRVAADSGMAGAMEAKAEMAPPPATAAANTPPAETVSSRWASPSSQVALSSEKPRGIANNFAQRNGERLDAAAMLETALGPLASEETRRAVARAESKPQALTLVLMAPEFQWR